CFPRRRSSGPALGAGGGGLGAAVGVVAAGAGRRAVAGTTVTAGLLGGHLGAGSGGVGVRRRVVPVVVAVVAVLAVLPAGAVPLGPRFGAASGQRHLGRADDVVPVGPVLDLINPGPRIRAGPS